MVCNTTWCLHYPLAIRHVSIEIKWKCELHSILILMVFWFHLFNSNNKQYKVDFNITAAPFYGVRTKPADKFVWNSYLLQKCREVVHPDWLLFLIHGFVDQKSILLTLQWTGYPCVYMYRCRGTSLIDVLL